MKQAEREGQRQKQEHNERERERERERDRQTERDRDRERETDRQTDRQRHRQLDRETEKKRVQTCNNYIHTREASTGKKIPRHTQYCREKILQLRKRNITHSIRTSERHKKHRRSYVHLESSIKISQGGMSGTHSAK